MFARLWTRIKAWIVEEVPDEMSACLDCRAAQCRDGQFVMCPNRLKISDGIKALRSAEIKGTASRNC